MALGNGILFQTLDDSEPVDLGHHKIKQDDVGQLRLRECNAFLSAPCGENGVAHRLEDSPDQLERHRIVVDRKHLPVRRQWRNPSERARAAPRGRPA